MRISRTWEESDDMSVNQNQLIIFSGVQSKRKRFDDVIVLSTSQTVKLVVLLSFRDFIRLYRSSSSGSSTSVVSGSGTLSQCSPLLQLQIHLQLAAAPPRKWLALTRVDRVSSGSDGRSRSWAGSSDVDLQRRGGRHQQRRQFTSIRSTAHTPFSCETNTQKHTGEA